MSNYILFHDNSNVTGKELRTALNIPGGTVDPGERSDHLIRWGNRGNIRFTPNKTLNKKEALDNSANKRRALGLLTQSNIKTVPLVDRFSGELLVARKDSHQQGEDFYLVASQRDFELAQHLGCTHYTTFIPCEREYRIHMFGGSAIGIAEKRMGNSCSSLTIRNLANGWNFKYVDNCDENIKQISNDVIRVLGLDFAAVDIMRSVNGNIYVLEVNSAPALVIERDGGEVERVPMFDKYVLKMREWLNE